MVEYGLITALISLLSFSAVTLVGDSTSETFDDVATAMEHSPGGGGSVSDPGGGSGDGSATTSTTLPPATTTTTQPPATTTTTAAPTTTTVPPPTTTTTTAPSEAPGSAPTPLSSESEITSWEKRGKSGNGEGEWKASVGFGNDSAQDQYLTLQVTEIDHSGNLTTKTIVGFQVPAGSSATFGHEGNYLNKSGVNITGVVEVQVQVISITTTDQAGQTVTYPLDDAQITTVGRPETP